MSPLFGKCVYIWGDGTPAAILPFLVGDKAHDECTHCAYIHRIIVSDKLRVYLPGGW